MTTRHADTEPDAVPDTDPTPDPTPDPAPDPDPGSSAGAAGTAGTADVRRASGRGPRRLVPLLAAVMVLASLAAALWTAHGVAEERSAAADERAALATGREAAVAFTSYDHRRIEEDLERVAAMSTGDFREEFTRALGALTEAIEQAEGVSAGTVTQAGLLRIGPDSAVVAAAVDASVTNRQTEEPALRRYRLQITLARDGSDWLISDISPVA